MKNVLIVYYTGTGSTKLVAEEVQSNLSMKNVTADMHRLTEASKDDLIQKAAACQSLILIYAVHAFNAPDLVYTWLRDLNEQGQLTDGMQKKAMVISVSGGGDMLSNTACRVKAKRLLEKKRFKVVTEAMVAMPNNWMSATPDDISKALIGVMPKKVDQWIDAFIQNKAVGVLPTKVIDRVITSLGRLEVKGGIQFGKNIKVGEACNGCGWCANNCPASNITMVDSDRAANNMQTDHAIPIFGQVCHFCLGCIYGCPQKALTPGKMKFAVIPTGYPLNKYMQQPEVPLTESEIMAQLKGVSWNGVRRYLEE